VRRPSRNLQVFSLSALDLIAMATGVFVLLLVLLMPYYRRSFDAAAEIEAVRVASTETRAKVADVSGELELLRGKADAAVAETARLQGETAQLIARAQSLDAEVRGQARPQALRDVTPTTVRELDLVFVVDTTASMRPVLSELASAMRAITRILQQLVPSVRVGVAAYNDSDTGFPPLQTLPLSPADTAGLVRIVAFIENLTAVSIGSRTIEEDLHLGINAAVQMRFRPGAKQVLVVMADAPAHDWAQAQVIARVRGFTLAAPTRSVSSLFVWTPNARRNEAGAREFLAMVAQAGGGTYTEHTGGLIENVLLAVLTS
jgi:Mg-chelatase subunit ChlD